MYTCVSVSLLHVRKRESVVYLIGVSNAAK